MSGASSLLVSGEAFNGSHCNDNGLQKKREKKAPISLCTKVVVRATYFIPSYGATVHREL